MGARPTAVLGVLAAGPKPVTAVARSLDIERTALESSLEDLAARGLVEYIDDEVHLAEGVAYDRETLKRVTPSSYAVHVEDCVVSTNGWAADLLQTADDRVLAVAERQRGGRGRRGRSWRSPPGGIWASLADGRARPVETGWVEGLALALATTDAIRLLGLDASLKWPNDVTLDGGKLAGILVEIVGGQRRERTIAGVGLNANVDVNELPDRATSLQAHVGPVRRAPLLGHLVHRFEGHRSDPDATLAAWRTRCQTIGRHVSLERPDGVITGDAVGLTDTGALVVDTGDDTLVVRPERCRRLRYV